MRVLIQRVSEASVAIDGLLYSSIHNGLLILVGIEEADGEEDIDFLCKKIVQLRIFNDENGIMNHSVSDVNGEILCVSQFTLQASVKKGNRPSYIKAAKPMVAVVMYDDFCDRLQEMLGRIIKKGKFGADMKVALINDGPVTIWIDSKNKE